MSALLKVEDIHKRYGTEEVLRGVSFEVERGQAKVFIGPSGTGKSTLLRCINQLTPPDKGRVFLEGAEVTHHRSDINRLRASIGFVFQDFNLLLDLTVKENIALPLRFSRKKEEGRVKAMLKKFDIEDVANATASRISGGEAQRAAIARAMMNDPKIILADEPTGNLDSDNTENVMEMFGLVREDFGATIVLATHDKELSRHATAKILLENGKATIRQ